MKTTKLT